MAGHSHPGYCMTDRATRINHTVDECQALHEKWFLQLFDSSLCSLRISVTSALNISRDYSYAEITEIRRAVSYTHLTLPTNREV